VIDISPRAKSPMEVGRSSSQSALSERAVGMAEEGEEDCPLTANLSYEP